MARVRFGDLKIDDEFEAYGDEVSNYDYAKPLKCKKVDETTGEEIGDCRFCMHPDDLVYTPGSLPPTAVQFAAGLLGGMLK